MAEDCLVYSYLKFIRYIHLELIAMILNLSWLRKLYHPFRILQKFLHKMTKRFSC